MKKFYLYIVFVSLISCSEKELTPISTSLGKPGAPENVSVESISGGATITYRVPNVKDILGVKAVYELADGKQREEVASFYKDSITILGYNDEEEHTVSLYTFNRAMELSDPVNIVFTPLESSISKVCKSFNIARDFGGARFTWKNEDRAPMTVELLTTDSLGVMSSMRIITSSTKEGSYVLRGYDTDPRWFAAILRDNYGNVTDTIFPVNAQGEKIQLSPLFEQEIKGSNISIIHLNNDASFSAFDGREENMFDDNLDSFGHSANGTLPAGLTLDLGGKIKVSRFVIYPRVGYAYGHGNPKNFEVYYSPDIPQQDGDWSQWTKIMDCEVIKPSGQGEGTVTDEDREAAKEGHAFDMDIAQEPIQYIRFLFTKMWSSATFCHVCEIKVYGDPNYQEQNQ